MLAWQVEKRHLSAPSRSRLGMGVLIGLHLPSRALLSRAKPRGQQADPHTSFSTTFQACFRSGMFPDTGHGPQPDYYRQHQPVRFDLPEIGV